MDEVSAVPAGMPPLVKEAFDRHGYSLQYAVARYIDERMQRRAGWSVHAHEFPVSVGGKDTRVDLVLNLRGASLYAACECKRVNPAYSAWVFARVPWQNWAVHEVRIDKFIGDGERREAYTDSAGIQSNPYHVAVVVRVNEKGDVRGGAREDAIEDAVTQVLRGASGLIRFFDSQHQRNQKGVQRWVLPVLITTATLWTTEADLSEAGLADGRLTGEPDLQAVPWLWYQHHASESLQSGSRLDRLGRSPRDAMLHAVRSVAIVNSLGLEEFLESVQSQR